MKRCTRDHTLSRASTCWHPIVSALATPMQKEWLTRPGALTAGLRKLGHLDLVVLRESRVPATADEASTLSVARSTLLWSREIAMRIDGIISVVARSVTPLAASRGIWQGVRQLGARPLADILYHDHRVVRLAFEFANCRRPDPLSAVASGVLAGVSAGSNQPSAPTAQQATDRLHAVRLWSRRSVFVRAEQHLLVSECFLPAFWQIVLSKQAPRGTIAP